MNLNFLASKGDRKLARLRCGEVVGEMSFVDYGPPSATVRAVEKSWVLAIERGRLQTKLTQDIAFAARFYRTIVVFLSDRLRGIIGLLGYTAGQSLHEDPMYADEIDIDALDDMSLAGDRFDLLEHCLSAI